MLNQNENIILSEKQTVRDIVLMRDHSLIPGMPLGVLLKEANAGLPWDRVDYSVRSQIFPSISESDQALT